MPLRWPLDRLVDYFDDIAAGVAANRNGLWAVVHDLCLPAYQGIGVAFPCIEVNIANGLDRGFAVLQKPSRATHVIVVPTIPVSGIESPALRSEDTPNYWEAAWGARRFVEERAGRRLPRDKIGMAINSTATRSQDQLHIHVTCVAPLVADFLRRHQGEIRGAWSFLRVPLLGHRFAVMKVETDGLANVDPFSAGGRAASLVRDIGIGQRAFSQTHSSHLNARLLTILSAMYKIDNLSDPSAARTIETVPIAWIVVFAVVHGETVPFGRRNSGAQIYMKPTFD